MSQRPSDPVGEADGDGARSGFQVLAIDVARALDDLDAFDALLASKAALDERADILPFFAGHPHLTLCFGFYNPLMARYDRVAYELSLFGHFRPDIVVGDWRRKAYCFVEMEDATPGSIFRATARRSPDWASRFQRGYCQVVDWFWLLDAQQDTPTFEAQFGQRSIQASGLLVLGRDRFLDAADQQRFEWWREHVVVDSRAIVCLTYDQLARDFRDRLLTAQATARP